MMILLYGILLLLISIGKQHSISADIIDLLSVDDKNGILNSIAYRSKTWLPEDQLIDMQINTDNSCQQLSMHSCDSSWKETINQLNKDLSIGEKLELTSASMAITLEKVPPNNITGKHLVQSNGAEVRVPQLNVNESIILNFVTLPSSSIVSLTVHNQDGQQMNIKNTTHPFEIVIPRKSNMLMPPLARQNVTALSNKTTFRLHYINLTHDPNAAISLHIDMEPENTNLSYLFVIRFSAVPDLKADLVDEWKLFCPTDRTLGTSKYTYFIDNTRISDHQWAVLSIHELQECHRDNLATNNIPFSSDYSIRMYTSGCYYLDENNQWQSDGLTVGPKTNEHFTQCFSTHLTTFAGGFLVLPAPIDFNSLQLDPKRNPTIYVTLILLGVLYLVTLALARHKDNIDGSKLMVIPLHDNNRRDTYLYQLVVFTGMRHNAGTKSKVHLILSGNNNETNIRTLTADRQILDRGSTDSFIMAVPRSLGQLNYLRVWHDNSGFGSDASWYLKYILVRDLQTMETSYFICENWLAVEKDSGEIDRTLYVASQVEQAELKHVLSKKAYRSLADNHLWFSIFAYHLPAANRFTRVQRCTCCFVLLFISLLMSIMYYGTKQDIHDNKANQNGLVIGPFRISKEEIGVGITVELIIFVPSILLVALFRRSKPRHPRQISPVTEAIQNIRRSQSTTQTKQQTTEAKKKKFLLPWWCLIIAYALSFLMVATAVFFILVRGAAYGDAKVQRWLGSIVTSLFASILLTEPFKVLSLAILFMCLCRKKSEGEAFIEDEDPVEDFTVSTDDAHRKFPPKSLLAKTRLDPYYSRREKAALEELREFRLREVKSWLILRELFFLLLFLGILYAISFANRDVENSHRMVNYLRQEFLKVDRLHQCAYSSDEIETNTKSYVFNNIRSIEDYWRWLEEVFVPKYNEVRWNDKSASHDLLQYNNRSIKIVGWPTLRQLRVKNETCPRKALRGHIDIDNCNLPYTWYNEDNEPFGFNVSMDDPKQRYTRAFKYQPSHEKTLIHTTSHATYMSGGYVHEIDEQTPEKIIISLRNLIEHRWIDRRTRAVFLTFGLYNANANLFVHCSLLLEQLPITASLILHASFQPFKLVQLYTGTDLIYCLIYLALVIYYAVAEIKLMIKMRKSYIKQFWSYINWAIIGCSVAGVVIHVLRQTALMQMRESLKKRTEHNLVTLQVFSYLDSILTYLLGFCCFFGTLKILRLARFNRRMSYLHLTLQKSTRQMLGFLLMFSIVFFAFIVLFYLLFHSHVQEYSSLGDTSLTCFEMVALHFTTVSDLKRVDPLLAGLCLFLFIFLAVLLLSNMFISIIVDNFNDIRREQLERPNEVELIQFTVNKVKQLLGFRSRRQRLEKKINLVSEFPSRIDQLMFAVDKMQRGTKR